MYLIGQQNAPVSNFQMHPTEKPTGGYFHQSLQGHLKVFSTGHKYFLPILPNLPDNYNNPQASFTGK
jgi:hypothetical protein